MIDAFDMCKISNEVSKSTQEIITQRAEQGFYDSGKIMITDRDANKLKRLDYLVYKVLNKVVDIDGKPHTKQWIERFDIAPKDTKNENLWCVVAWDGSSLEKYEYSKETKLFKANK